jgi:hypothetical protein
MRQHPASTPREAPPPRLEIILALEADPIFRFVATNSRDERRLLLWLARHLRHDGWPDLLAWLADRCEDAA